MFAEHTPWHYLIVWLTIQPLDPTMTSVLVRLPAALAGALLVPLVFALGRECFGRPAGLLAATLTACSTTLLGVAQDARPYAFLAFFTVLSVYCFQVAQRTGRAAWWAAWAAATIANLLNSYTALTLVVPAVLPCWGLALVVLGLRRAQRPTLRFALPAAGLIALVALTGLIEIAQLTKVPPDLTQTAAIRGTLLQVVGDWLAQGNVPFDLGNRLQWAGVGLAAAGVVIGLCGSWRERLAVGFSVLLIVIPLAEIAALGTTNNVSARYIVFIQPFYYLLIGRCFQFLIAGLTNPSWRYAWVRLPAAAVSSGVLLVTLAGLLVFPAVAWAITRQTATAPPASRSITGPPPTTWPAPPPEDTVVFIDDPPHGVDVSRFYWHWQDPAHIYDVRDPRLATATASGAVYWVVGLFYYNPAVLDQLAAQGWADTARFYGVAVLRDHPPA